MKIISQCWICGRIWWAEHAKCPHCGGLCRQYPEQDVRLMSRHAAAGDRQSGSVMVYTVRG